MFVLLITVLQPNINFLCFALRMKHNRHLSHPQVKWSCFGSLDGPHISQISTLTSWNLALSAYTTQHPKLSSFSRLAMLRTWRTDTPYSFALSCGQRVIAQMPWRSAVPCTSEIEAGTVSECRKNWDSRSPQLEKSTFFYERVKSFFSFTAQMQQILH